MIFAKNTRILHNTSNSPNNIFSRILGGHVSPSSRLLRYMCWVNEHDEFVGICYVYAIVVKTFFVFFIKVKKNMFYMFF